MYLYCVSLNFTLPKVSISLCVHGCARGSWRAVFWHSLPSSHHVDPEDRTQIVRLGGRLLYPLSLHASPVTLVLELWGFYHGVLGLVYHLPLQRTAYELWC